MSFEGDSDSLIGWLGRLCDGWGAEPTSDDGETPLRVARRDGAFHIEAPWLDAPVVEPDPFRAAANLAVDLAEAWLAENPDRLTLHCAAAALDGRLIIFPGTARAGKSTLAARLAAAGWDLFADDMLILGGADERSGSSFGIAPRLRRPLPPGIGDMFRDFLAAHEGPGDEDYLYLDLPGAVRPRFGKTARIGAVVLLERGVPGARIEAASPGDGVEALLLQNLSPRVGASGAIGRIAALIEAVPCHVLHYSDLDDAAELLARTVRSGAMWMAPDRAAPPAPSGERPAWSGPSEPQFRPAPGVAVHEVDGVRYLVCARSDGVYRLDDLAFGLWNLMAEPVGTGEAAAIVQSAFPDRDPDEIERDVRLFFETLTERDLIRPA
ncbi:MAG: PqqD family peptide modification chaperone [Sphingomonas sp.]|nr:PqqD family peptide modification chaperone [Sphingomonas sp.]